MPQQLGDWIKHLKAVLALSCMFPHDYEWVRRDRRLSGEDKRKRRRQWQWQWRQAGNSSCRVALIFPRPQAAPQLHALTLEVHQVANLAGILYANLTYLSDTQSH